MEAGGEGVLVLAIADVEQEALKGDADEERHRRD